jgi:hypothetical protein
MFFSLPKVDFSAEYFHAEKTPKGFGSLPKRYR